MADLRISYEQPHSVGTEPRTSPASFRKQPSSSTSEMKLDFTRGMICKLALRRQTTTLSISSAGGASCAKDPSGANGNSHGAPCMATLSAPSLRAAQRLSMRRETPWHENDACSPRCMPSCRALHRSHCKIPDRPRPFLAQELVVPGKRRPQRSSVLFAVAWVPPSLAPEFSNATNSISLIA